MKPTISNLLPLSSILMLILILNACSSNFPTIDRDIRYIKSRINTANKKSFVLQDGTTWGFSHFFINTPGNDVIITYYESNIGGTAYINGIQKNVTYLGAYYDNSLNVNNILKFNEGNFLYISRIDSSGTIIALDDSTNWIVRPDQRYEVKKWEMNEKIILDKGKQFIINPRIYEMANVQQVTTKDNK